MDIDDIVRRPVLYSRWEAVLIGGLCSAAIAPVTFNASFIDSMMALVLGALLVFVRIQPLVSVVWLTSRLNPGPKSQCKK